MRDWPLLLVAAVLLICGGVQAASTGDLDALSISLMTAGLISLGAWLAVEVRDRWKDGT